MTPTGNARQPPRNRKASPMTRHTLSASAGPRIAGLLRGPGRKLSDHAHAPGDDRARAAGWHVTATPGPLGLQGRSYRDPRFATRGNPQPTQASRKGTP